MASSRARICSVPLSEAEQELVGVDPGGKLARLNAAGQRMVHVPEQLVALGDAVIFVDGLKPLMSIRTTACVWGAMPGTSLIRQPERRLVHAAGERVRVGNGLQLPAVGAVKLVQGGNSRPKRSTHPPMSSRARRI